MHGLWKHYNKAYNQYEKKHPLAFPWSRSGKKDVPRYELGVDGYCMTLLQQKPERRC